MRHSLTTSTVSDILNTSAILPLTNMLVIEKTQRHNNFIHYTEDVWVTDDCVMMNNKQLAAFTITEDLSGPHVGDYNARKYRVNQRVELHQGVYIYEKIFGADTVCECKELIEQYINEPVTKEIMAS